MKIVNKTGSLTMDAHDLIASIKMTNNGYLSCPTSQEIQCARLHPGTFTVCDLGLYAQRISLRKPIKPQSVADRSIWVDRDQPDYERAILRRQFLES